MKSDAKRSVLWSGVQNIASQGIHFIITIIIARILTPEDYGVVAMLSIFFALAQAFIDSGLSGALIQKKDCTEKDFNSVFVFGVSVAVVFYLIFFVSAPLIAKLYNNELLINLTRVYLFNLVINAVGIVPMTIMQKNLQFKQFAVISISISLFAGVVAIFMAYCGMAYWALVMQIMITSTLSSIAYYIKTKWRPTFSFSMDSFKSMISYGFPVMLTSIVHAVYNNVYSLIIGAKYSAKDLGLFNRAYSFTGIVPNTISNFTMRGMFPILSRIQDDRPTLVNKIYEILHLTLYIVLPINIYVLFNCTDVIQVILGEKWLGIVPYIRILCISCMAYIYTNLHMTTFKTIGRTKQLFVSETVRKVLGLLTVLITAWYGVMAMVYGLLVYSIVDVVVSTLFLRRQIAIGIRGQIKESLSPAILSVIAGVVTILLSFVISNLYIRFFVCLAAFGGSYILLSVLFKERGVRFFMNYFK